MGLKAKHRHVQYEIMIAGSLACGGTQQLNGLVNTKGVEMDNALPSMYHKTEDFVLTMLLWKIFLSIYMYCTLNNLVQYFVCILYTLLNGNYECVQEHCAFQTRNIALVPNEQNVTLIINDH